MLNQLTHEIAFANKLSTAQKVKKRGLKKLISIRKLSNYIYYFLAKCSPQTVFN